MKIKEGFMLRQVAGSYVVVAYGQRAVDFNGMITLNETGAFLWEQLSKGADKEGLLASMLEAYEIDSETASRDIDSFLKKLEDAGIAE